MYIQREGGPGLADVAAALTWADVEAWADGSGRVSIARSKTDSEGTGQAVYTRGERAGAAAQWLD